ncbi:MAG TPA: hypothetical protein VLT36_09005, partial [Candidatus Dormibacteraeota bacterium]|nr:hypothetical protein [Candidatus Dormibacteraeota bacterium]
SGLLLSFDQTISAASRKGVLRTDNSTDNLTNLGGPFVTGSGSSGQVWMSVSNSSTGAGVRRWSMTTNGVVGTNDAGSIMIQAGGLSDLDQHGDDVAVDRSNRIYVVQNITGSGDASSRVFRFPAYSGSAETVADWKVGSGDDTMAGASGIAVNPAGNFVAVAFTGLFGNGSLQVLSATNGSVIAALGPNAHDYWDVAWDNAGNLYTVDGFDGLWRVFSPAGTNQSSTVSLQQVQVASPAPPVLTWPQVQGGSFQFTLVGQSNVVYVIQRSSDFQNWVPVSTNVSPTSATQQISIPTSGTPRFFRAKVGP